MSRIFRSLDGDIPERSIHYSDVVIEQLIVGSSAKMDDKLIKDQELAGIMIQIEQKYQELEQIRNSTEEIIENARESALKLVEQAQIEAEDIRATARESGIAEGHQVGFEQGLLEADKHVQEAKNVLQLSEQERRERIASSESFLIDLSMKVVEKIAREYVESDEGYVPQLVQTLLGEVERAFKVEVRVSPHDFPSVIHHRHSFERSFIHRVELLFIPDRSLVTGDVVIATEYGTVDGRLGTRLEQLHQSLTSLAKEWESRVAADTSSE